MNERRSQWVETVALLHLFPGVMTLLAVSFILWLAGLATWTVNGEEMEWLRNLILLLLGITLLAPILLALPFFFVGLGLLRRRAWARFVALYMAFGLAGTGLLLLCAQGKGIGVLPLAHGSFTLAVLLLPRSARELQ